MSVFVGFAAGALHALTGPDHLAALIPSCIGQRLVAAGRVGARWGLGHGLGAVLFGLLAFSVKGYFDISALSEFMEGAVGLTLIAVGYVGFKESLEWRRQAHCLLPSHLQKEEYSPKGFDTKIKANPSHSKAKIKPTSTIMMGIVHGFTGTGHLIGVMPALVMPSFMKASLYLGGFCAGTLVAMAMFTSAIGEASLKISTSSRNSGKNQLRRGKNENFEDLIADRKVLSSLGFFSSGVAIIMGIVWIFRSSVFSQFFAFLLKPPSSVRSFGNKKSQDLHQFEEGDHAVNSEEYLSFQGTVDDE